VAGEVGVSTRRLTAALTVLACALSTEAAAGAPSFALYGAGTEPLRPGIPAVDADITSMPISLAVRSDDTVAFSAEGVVYWIRDGRLLRVPVPAYEGHSLVFAANGELLISACGSEGLTPSAVFRAGPGRPAKLVAGRPGAARSAGDGGPATAATLECPSGIDVDAAGGILIADAAARRIRRVDPGGIIATAAGSGSPGGGGDGGPATAASLEAPLDVAALPGGAFAVLDGSAEADGPNRVRIVDPGGLIRTVAQTTAGQMSGAPDGSLLLSGFDDEEQDTVRRWHPDGTVGSVTTPGQAAGIPRFVPLAGDRAGESTGASDAVAAPDGGVLFAADFVIRYVAPAAPSLLGLAILPETRRLSARPAVAVRTTRPGRVHAGVWRSGRKVAGVTAPTAGGDLTLPLAGRFAGGLYEVRVSATDGRQRAAATAAVFVGGLLPIRIARAFVASALGDHRIGLRCRRITRTEVHCGMFRGKRCRGVAALELRPDGSLLPARYDGNRRCRAREVRRGPP
jgi:hypothetical protein